MSTPCSSLAALRCVLHLCLRLFCTTTRTSAFPAARPAARRPGGHVDWHCHPGMVAHLPRGEASGAESGSPSALGRVIMGGADIVAQFVHLPTLSPPSEGPWNPLLASTCIPGIHQEALQTISSVAASSASQIAVLHYNHYILQLLIVSIVNRHTQAG